MLRHPRAGHRSAAPRLRPRGIRYPPGVRPTAPLAAAFLAATLAAAPARAVEEDSLRAAASFGLFRDPYDLLREPASLSELEGRHLYTLIGNQGGGGRATLGYAGRAGPGFLGVFGDFQASGSTASSQVAEVEDPSAPRQVSSTDAFSDAVAWGIFAGYGLHPGRGPISVGIGIGYEGSRWSASLGPRAEGEPPVIGGTLEGHSTGGDADLAEEGEYRERRDAVRAVVGMAVETGRGSVEVDAHLAWDAATAEASLLQSSGGTTYALEGAYPGLALGDDGEGLRPGGAVDATLDLGRGIGLRALGTLEGGRRTPRIGWTTETTVLEGAPVVETRQEWRDAEIREWGGEALVVLHARLGKVELRAGIGGAFSRSSGEGSRAEIRTEDGVAVEETVSQVTREESSWSVSTPIATEVALHPMWALRLGGRFRLEHLASEGSTALEGVPQGATVVEDAHQESQLRSEVEFALGLRFQPVEAFSLDALIRGTAIGEDRLSVNLGALFLSAVFHP